jgi:hypothetical protein
VFGLSRIVIVFRNTLNVLLVLNPPAMRGTLITHEAPDVQQHIIGDITCGLCITTRQRHEFRQLQFVWYSRISNGKGKSLSRASDLNIRFLEKYHRFTVARTHPRDMQATSTMTIDFCGSSIYFHEIQGFQILWIHG